jgi:hypothetical protein
MCPLPQDLRALRLSGHGLSRCRVGPSVIAGRARFGIVLVDRLRQGRDQINLQRRGESPEMQNAALVRGVRWFRMCKA